MSQMGPVAPQKCGPLPRFAMTYPSMLKEFSAFADDDVRDTQRGVQTDIDPNGHCLETAASELSVRLWWQRSDSAHPSNINPYAYMQGKYMIDCLNRDLRERDLAKGTEIVLSTNDPFADSKQITAQLLDTFDVTPSDKDDIENILRDYTKPGEDALDVLRMVRGEDEEYGYECDDDGIAKLIAEMNQSADYLLQAKRYADAIDDFERVLDVDASNAYALHGKGVALARLGRHAEAVQVFDTAPNAKDDPDILCHKGFSLTELKEYHKANKCFDAALATDPTDEWTLHEKVYVMLQLERYDDAIKCCDKLLEINPDNHKALTNKGFALLQTDKFAKAIDCFDAVLSVNNRDVDALDGRINVLHKLGRYDEALSNANDLLRARPDSLKPHYYKGHILIKLERTSEALECFDAILRSDDDAVRAWIHKGDLHMQLGEYKDAIGCFVRILDLLPPYKEVLNDMASCIMKEINSVDHYEDGVVVDDPNLNLDRDEKLMSYGEFLLYLRDTPERAIRYFDAVLHFIPGNTETLCDKAAALFQLGKYDDSIMCIDAVLATDPHNTLALNIKGASLLYTNKRAEAKSCFGNVLSLDPDNAIALLSMGLIFYKMHMYDVAAKYYDLVSVKGRAGIAALNGVGYVMIKTGRYNEALKHFSRAVEKYPRSGIFVLGRGVVLLQLERDAEALNCFERLPKTIADSRFVQSAKGEALFGLHRYDEAIKCYERVLEMT